MDSVKGESEITVQHWAEVYFWIGTKKIQNNCCQARWTDQCPITNEKFMTAAAISLSILRRGFKRGDELMRVTFRECLWNWLGGNGTLCVGVRFYCRNTFLINTRSPMGQIQKFFACINLQHTSELLVYHVFPHSLQWMPENHTNGFTLGFCKYLMSPIWPCRWKTNAHLYRPIGGPQKGCTGAHHCEWSLVILV